MSPCPRCRKALARDEVCWCDKRTKPPQPDILNADELADFLAFARAVGHHVRPEFGKPPPGAPMPVVTGYLNTFTGERIAVEWVE